MKILAVFIFLTIGVVLSLDLGRGGVFCTTKDCKSGSKFFTKLAEAQKNINKEATKNKNDKNKPTTTKPTFSGSIEYKYVPFY